MQNKLRTFLLLIGAMLVLVGCESTGITSESNNDYEDLQAAFSDRIDAPVEIDADYQFLSMNQEEKDPIYQDIDEVVTNQGGDKRAADYSQVQVLAEESDYVNLLLESNDEPKIIYFGFDECPFCTAFIPKLNHFATEIDAPIYYYDVRAHGEDPTFAAVIENFQFETVPQAFILEDGEPRGRINHHSSMATIEDFILTYQDKVAN